jgi:hypothetical protein
MRKAEVSFGQSVNIGSCSILSRHGCVNTLCQFVAAGNTQSCNTAVFARFASYNILPGELQVSLDALPEGLECFGFASVSECFSHQHF